MFLIHTIQRDEDGLVIDCQQYCLEHLVNRIYEPEPLTEAAPAGPAYSARDRGHLSAAPLGRPERVPR